MGKKGRKIKSNSCGWNGLILIIVLFCFSLFCMSGCGKNEKKISSSNLNSCEVDGCFKDGTNKIMGISGEAEYYCDEHYEDMKEMAEKIIGDNDVDNKSENMPQEGIDNDTDKIDTKKQEPKVFQTYKVAINLTKDQLIKTTKGYSYSGLDLLSEDCDWIDNSLNETGTVNQGAIYRKISKLLQGFEMKVANYQDFSEILIGFIPETRDDFIPYAENAKTFITFKNDFKSIMKKFESLDCVKGSFEYKTGKLGKYSFEIQDLTSCAKEMQISEEMLGYIFAFLDEYAPKIKFNENKCSFNYKDSTENSQIKKISKKDFIAKYNGEKHNILKENGHGYISYFAYDASVDESKEDVIKTNRGICIGDTKKDVLKKYGKAKEIEVNLDNNDLYQYFLSENMLGFSSLMQMQCHSYITYTYKKMSITFYFYESKKVSWIVFIT